MKRIFSLLLMFILVIVMAISASAATTVSKVEAFVPTPVVGDTISTTLECYTATEGVSITDLNWTKENGAIYPEDTVFQVGVTYYCDIEFRVEDGYTFPSSYTQLSGTVNGIAGEISTVYYTDHAYVVVAFTPVQDGEVFVGGVGLKDGDYLHSGTNTPIETMLTDSYAYYNDGVLTLHNYEYNGPGFVLGNRSGQFSGIIYSDYPLNIMVEGDNTLTGSQGLPHGEGIWLNTENAKITGVGVSSLNFNLCDVGIFSTGKLTLKDMTIVSNARSYLFETFGCLADNCTLQINSIERGSIYCRGTMDIKNSAVHINSKGFGINCNGNVNITGSDFEVVAADYGVFAYGDHEINVSSSDFHVNAVDYAVYASDITLSFVVGNVSSTKKSSFYSAGGVTIEGSTLNMTAADSGIEAYSDAIDISTSTLEINSMFGIYVDGHEIIVKNSSITATAYKYAIDSFGSDIIITDSELELFSTNLEFDKDYCALAARSGTITFSEGLYVYGSTEPDGKLVPYVAENSDSYDWVKVSMTALGPVIESQPNDTYVKNGTTAWLMVTATGKNLKYQWQYRTSSTGSWKNASAAGNTTKTLSVPATVSRNGYQYRCRITDGSGNKVYTNTVKLFVLSIKTQPVSTNVENGVTANFAVSATGGKLKYQWQYRTSSTGSWKNAAATGNKTKTLSVPGTISRNGYQYRCRITDGAGNIIYSKTATLNVLGIKTHPVDQAVVAGKTAKYTVVAVGKGLKYQWEYRTSSGGNWKNASATGNKTKTLSVQGTISRHSYQYRCKVSDSAGNIVYTRVVRLRVLGIKTQPVSAVVSKGQTAKVSVVAAGDGLTYTWYYRNVGTTSFRTATSFTGNTYSVKMDASSNGREVYCVVKDQYGSTVKTKTAVLQMKGALLITMQPESVKARVGDEAGFGVVVTGGTKPYTYRWEQYNSKTGKWEKAAGEVLTVGQQNMLVVIVKANTYNLKYRCLITDSKGNTIYSNVVKVLK